MQSFIAVTIPDLTRTQLNLLNTIQTNLHCNNHLLNATTGVTLTSTTATLPTVALTGPERLRLPMTAYGDFRSATDGDVLFTYESQISTAAMQQAQQTPTVLPFFYLDEINSTLTPIDTTTHFVLPSFLTSIVYAHNLQLSHTVTLNSSIELVIDSASIMRIISGNISDWHDSRLIALNPILSHLLDSNPAPITFVFACINSKSGWPLYQALNNIVSAQAPYDIDLQDALGECDAKGIFEAWLTCGSVPGTRWLTVNQEVAIPALVLNNVGAIGYMMDATSVLGNGKFALKYPYYDPNNQDGKMVQTVRHSNPNGLMACAESGFDADTLTIDIAAAGLADSDCYPVSQVVVTQVPLSYPNNLAQLGVETLEALQWLYSTDELDAYATANMIIRTTSIPAIQSPLLATLHTITDADDVPLLHLPLTWRLTPAIGGLSMALAVLAGVLTVAAMVVTVRYASHPVFRSSSPSFMLISFTGLLVLCAAMLQLSLVQTNGVCAAFTWCTQMGFTLIFAPLFSKAYRIYRIFGRRKLKVVKLTNRKLLAGVAAAIIADIIYLIVWHAVAPPTVITIPQFTTPASGAGGLITTFYGTCAYADASSHFFQAVAVGKLLMLAAGVMLAFGTRQVTSQFNESKIIGFCIYNLVFAIGIIIPILLVINAIGDTANLLLLFLLAEITYTTLGLLFVPKLLSFYAARRAVGDGVSVNNSSMGGSLSDGYSFLSFSQMSTPAMLQPYIGALEKHLIEAKKTLASMKRDGLYGGRPSAGSNANPKASPGTVGEYRNLNNPISPNSRQQPLSPTSVLLPAPVPRPLDTGSSPAAASRALISPKAVSKNDQYSTSAARRQAWSHGGGQFDVELVHQQQVDETAAEDEQQAEQQSQQQPAVEAASAVAEDAAVLPAPGVVSEEWESARHAG